MVVSGDGRVLRKSTKGAEYTIGSSCDVFDILHGVLGGTTDFGVSWAERGGEGEGRGRVGGEDGTHESQADSADAAAALPRKIRVT